MAQAGTRRGRPKGTGIDDSASLRRLAEMLHANPGLKPTTAIRRLGFTNPSAIRRLRDKYKLLGNSAAATSNDTSNDQRGAAGARRHLVQANAIAAVSPPR